MSQNSVTRNPGAVGIIVAVLALAGCGPPTAPEAELEAWVRAAEEAAEARDRRALVAMISENYGDARGNDRDTIDKILRAYFLRQSKVAMLTKIDRIEVFGDSAAEISLSVGMAGTRNAALGIRADAYRFELELEKEDDDWQLIAARWGELGGELR